jgi:hypothetical protein
MEERLMAKSAGNYELVLVAQTLLGQGRNSGTEIATRLLTLRSALWPFSTTLSIKLDLLGFHATKAESSSHGRSSSRSFQSPFSHLDKVEKQLGCHGSGHELVYTKVGTSVRFWSKDQRPSAWHWLLVIDQQP